MVPLRTGTLHQVLLGSFHTFGDCGSYLARFTQAPAYDTGFVAHYDNSREAERTATFGYFRYTVDGNQSVFQLDVVLSILLYYFSCHDD